MDGLIVNEPFASMIIEGKKTWELRNRLLPTKRQGKEFYLLSKGRALGTVRFLYSIGPLSRNQITQNKDKHHCYKLTSAEEPVFAWIVKVEKKYKRPLRYRHPMGARIWVRNVKVHTP